MELATLKNQNKLTHEMQRVYIKNIKAIQHKLVMNVMKATSFVSLCNDDRFLSVCLCHEREGDLQLQ